MSRRDLLSMHWSDIDGDTLDKVITTLEGGGVIESHASGSGTYLRLSNKTIDRMGLVK